MVVLDRQEVRGHMTDQMDFAIAPAVEIFQDIAHQRRIIDRQPELDQRAAESHLASKGRRESIACRHRAGPAHHVECEPSDPGSFERADGLRAEDQRPASQHYNVLGCQELPDPFPIDIRETVAGTDVEYDIAATHGLVEPARVDKVLHP